jgi:glycosyltransferase involved in cell wall biosynthesis
VDRLIAAFAEVVAPAIPKSRLEIVGENRTFPRVDLSQMVARLAPQHLDRIVVREYVDEHTLASLYASAAVFAFPSEYEGFGLTPLEALAAGVPPVVLDTRQARETYGEAACYVSPGLSNVSDLGGAIAALLRDDEARRRILARAPAVLARYDWSRAARETLSAIETAAGV